MKTVCEQCGEETPFVGRPSHKRFCSTLCAQRWRRKNNRPKYNAERRKWVRKDRQETLQRLGAVCGFGDCGVAHSRLHTHHDHVKQARLNCCRASHGCKECQVCMLCPTHNFMLGLMGDDVRIARNAVQFLERYHESKIGTAFDMKEA